MKNLLKKYTAFLLKVLAPLGPWGAFGIAAVDSAALGLPMDLILATYIYAMLRWLQAGGVQPASLHWLVALYLLYPALAALGSAVGSLLIYIIGRKGGEVALRKRISQAKFDAISERFESREFLALMIPSMLPPPTPFKLFVFAAGALKMKVRDFLLAIFLGRLVRWIILAKLVVSFGPAIVERLPVLFHQHPQLKFVAIFVGIAVVAVIYFLIRRPVAELAHEAEK
ncbi:MAG TPA: VTT domain-containing protein [Terriglobales bacterium]|nr:VTT domain-containing protein [Terriglobales bacterium]